MLQLNAIKSYAKDKTMRLPKYFATANANYEPSDFSTKSEGSPNQKIVLHFLTLC